MLAIPFRDVSRCWLSLGLRGPLTLGWGLAAVLLACGCERTPVAKAVAPLTVEVAPAAGVVTSTPLTTNRLIRVAIDPDYYPMEHLNRRGQLEGFDIQYLEALAAHLQHDLKLLPMPRDKILAAVAAGHADLGVSSLLIPTTSGDVQFVEYVGMPQVLVARAGRGIGAAADLKGKAVGTLALSSARSVYHARMNGGHVAKVRGYESEEALIAALLRDEVDAVVVNAATWLERRTHADPQTAKLVSLGPAGTDEPLGIAVARTDKGLAEAVDLAVARLRQDGTTDKLLTLWFGAGPSTAKR